jgi:hypothetical protein
MIRLKACYANDENPWAHPILELVCDDIVISSSLYMLEIL